MRMYFIGVTTGQSAIHRIFPEWMRIAGQQGAELRGIDIAMGANADDYRRALTLIREDLESGGALVTTHKVAIVEHAGDLIDDLDADAALLGEASCLVTRDRKLRASAVDVECSGWSLHRILTPAELNGRDVLILGAGGAGTALATFLHRRYPNCRLIVTDINPRRFAKLQFAECLSGNDEALSQAHAGAVIVNATGVGKDRPGSPLSDAACFPPDAIAWELNYRGDLHFLAQARAAGICAVDGWDYFVRGWSTITSRVFGFELTEPLFDQFYSAASAFNSRALRGANPSVSLSK